MSGAPTWAADRPDGAALARAGWSEADLTWEIVQSTAAGAAAAGDLAQAAELWQAGLDLAREHFGVDDPRRATSLANVGAARRRAGDAAAAEALFAEALAVWDVCGPWIDALRPETRARSSLFHLRLQTKHRGAYDRFARERHAGLAVAGRQATVDLRDGRRAAGPETWPSERPAGYGDLRKLIAAVFLLATE